MSRLVIDARTVRPAMTGVGHWAMELTKAAARLVSERGDGSVAALVLSKTRDDEAHARLERSWAEAESLRLVPVAWDYQNHPAADLWYHGGGLGRLLSDLKADVFLSPTFLCPLRAPCPRIATLLDFVAWRYPKTYPAKFRTFVRLSTRLAAWRAEALIALSRSVVRDARAILRIPRRRVRIVHPGVGPEFRPHPEGQLVAVRAAYGLPPPPYFLWVGSFERRKDLPTLLDAFERLHRERGGGQPGGRGAEEGRDLPPDTRASGVGGGGDRPSLLIVGRPVAGERDEAARLRNSPARAAIVWVPELPRRVLAAAMAGAVALTYPSRYEGFGLPVAEAMACGTPVVAARASSIPEVAGDAALLVRPGDADALRDAMRRVLDDAELRATLSRRGLARAPAFDWKRAAASVLELAEKTRTHARR